MAAKFPAEHPNMMYMPIIDILKPKGQALFAEYLDTNTVPLACEVCWSEYTPEVEACMREVVAGGSKLWVNSLWASLCGGLDDDGLSKAIPPPSTEKTRRYGCHHDPDRPSRTADLLPPARGLHD